MKKIIVYGLGNVYCTNKEYFDREFDVVAYSDKRRHDIEKYIQPKDINKMIFDYLVVTSDKHYKEIKQELVKELNIPADKIVSISELVLISCGLQETVKRNTSVTDNGLFPVFCAKAAEDEKVFETFRLNPFMRKALEHVTQEQGKLYIEAIEQNRNIVFLEKDWDSFSDNDLYGTPPRKNSYLISGREYNISPVTLRYVKVLQDILTLYDTDGIHSIAEIGIGYGGQCRILTSYLNGRDYSLIDLPEVLKLARKYIEHFPVKGNIRYVDGTGNIEKKEYDLLISNYAFSELKRSVQDFYLDNVISYSKRGYITWNSLSAQEGGYSVNELLNIIKGSYVIEEKPLTYDGNCIIVWH